MTKVYLVMSNWKTVYETTVSNVWRVYTNKKKALRKVDELNEKYPDLAGTPRWFTLQEEEISTI